MKIKTIKKTINHNALYLDGYCLIKVFKGFFKRNNIIISTAVLRYRKDKIINNVVVGYYYKNYNRFGLISSE